MLRLFLAASALAWLGLGVWIFIDPGALSGVAGVSTVTRSGSVELRAMYGGLPIAVGLLAALALRREDLQRPALLTLAFASTGLFTGRLLGAVLVLEATSFTASALLFEILSAAFATRLLVAPPRPTSPRR